MTACRANIPPGKPKVLVITGATASGKSSLAVRMALDLGGEIVNADSMQVYRGMDIGTAKPTTEERRGIPHHLLDVVDPDEPFDAAHYRDLALAAVHDIVSRGRVCLVVGGTGLYLRILLGGVFPGAPADLAVRRALRQEAEAEGAASLHQRLGRVDPDAARRIHPNDAYRIIRALEVLHVTGRRPSELMREHGFRDRPLNALKLCLDVPREDLYLRIDARSEEMLGGGLVEETRRLLAAGFGPGLKPMKAIGYRHAVEYLEGTLSLQETLSRLQRDTRRYAKRQMTWFRSEDDLHWVSPQAYDSILKMAADFLCQTS